MWNKNTHLRIWAAVVWVLFSLGAWAQPYIVEDPTAQKVVKEAMDQVYDCQGKKAIQTLNQLPARFKTHPVHPMLKGLALYWEFYPVESHSVHSGEYKKLMQESAQLSEKWYKLTKGHPEPIFFSMMSQMMLAKFNSDLGETMEAVGNMKTAWGHIKRGFDLTERFPEFQFTTGIYQYFREAYPEKHPAYQPFMLFFEKGDKERGIRMLQSAALNSPYTGPEAYCFLFRIYAFDRGDYVTAAKNSAVISKNFPNNTLFQQYHAEMLLFSKRYAEADSLLNATYKASQENLYLATYWHALRGYQLEHYNKNYRKAAEHFAYAAEKSKGLKKTQNHVAALAHLGLARQALRDRDPAKAKKHFKKAEDLTSAVALRREAEAGLKKH